MTNPLEAEKPEQSLDAALESFRARIQQVGREVCGSQVDDAEWWRGRLLKTIAGVITAEKVQGIRDTQDALDFDLRVDDLAKSVANSVHSFFDPFNLRVAISRKGPKRKFQPRDRKMLSMWKQGLTLGQMP